MPARSVFGSVSPASLSDSAEESLTAELGGDGTVEDGDEAGMNGEVADFPDNETLESETPKDALQDTKDAHEGKAHVILNKSVVGRNSCPDHMKDIAIDSKNATAGDVVQKGAQPLPKKTDLKTPDDLSLSSKATSHRRSRDSSPGSTLGNANKRPAVMCTFFARGWCIKGTLCKFLHQKEEVSDTYSRMKGDIVGTSKKGDLPSTGSMEETERSKLFASQELLDSFYTECSPKSPSNRALVRAYGRNNDGQPNSYGDLTMVEADLKSGKESHPSVNEAPQKIVQEELKKPFGMTSYSDTLQERQSADNDSLSSRYLNEGKPFVEMPRGNSLKDSPFSSSSYPARVALVSEYKSHSPNFTGSSLYQNKNPLAYDKKAYELSYLNQQSHVPPNGSYISYSLPSLLNTSISNPLLSVRDSTKVHGHGHAGSTSLSAEHLDTHDTSLFGRGNYGSHAASLPRISSPYFSRGDAKNIAQPSVPRDLRAFGGLETKGQDAWAPSVPYRSSFCNAPAKMSTYGSQYDPLLHSLEPPKTASVNFQSSESTIIREVSTQPMIGDPIRSGSHTPGYNTHIPVNSSPQAHEAVFGKEPPKLASTTFQSFETTVVRKVSTPPMICDPIRSGSHTTGYNAYNPVNSSPQAHEAVFGQDKLGHAFGGANAEVVPPGPSIADERKSSMPKVDKHSIPSHAINGVNGDETDPGGNQKTIGDKGRNNKESRTLKFFRVALVDFIKELVKPSWREGHLSKDAHKMIVQKAVEKVLGAILPHQVPNTADSVNQYLSTSRSKMLKLVEGYVEKYSKPGGLPVSNLNISSGLPFSKSIATSGLLF